MGGRDINARAYLSRFNFSGADQEKLCGVLSGGERNRLHLALCLKEEGNVLLLDEPTNHLDVDAKAELKRALQEYKGSILLICHEPEFYRDVVSKVWNCQEWSTRV